MLEAYVLQTSGSRAAPQDSLSRFAPLGSDHSEDGPLSGHASVRTTQDIYTHLTPDAEKSAAEKMGEILRPVAVTIAVKNAKIRPR